MSIENPFFRFAMSFPDERFRIINWQRVTAGMLFLLPCGYFIVYAAQFLMSAHGANFVAVLVHILGVLDLVGSLAFYPAKTGDIDHIRQFVIISY